MNRARLAPRMDARDKLTVPAGAAAAPDLEAIRRAYEMIGRADVVAGIEELLKVCHEDVEMRAYAARAVAAAGVGGQELLRGREEIRAFFRDSTESGFAVAIRTRGFDVEGDTVVVRGSIRVARPDGSFAETKLRWRFRFRDGLVDEIDWAPRAG
jgi:ketosteroid isomerase-like protein